MRARHRTINSKTFRRRMPQEEAPQLSQLGLLKPWLDERLLEVLARTGGITAHISLVDPVSDRLMLVHAVGQHAEVYETLRGPCGQGVTKRAADKKRSIRIPNAQDSKEWKAAMAEAIDRRDTAYAALLKSFHSEVAVTLHDLNGRIIGVVNVHHPDRDGLIRSVDTIRNAFKDAAGAITKAIPHVVAVESAEWLVEMDSAIRRIRQGLGTSTSLWELIVREAARLSRADFTALWMHHPCSNELQLAAFARLHGSQNPYASIRVPTTDGIKGAALKGQAAIYGDFTRPDCKWKPCVAGLRCSYVIPIVAENGHNLGVLCFNSYQTGDFPANLCKALNSFGELCSLLISRRVAEIEARVARECQRSFQEAEDNPRLFQRTVEKARRLLPAKGVSLFMINESGEALALAATTGLARDFDSDLVYRIDEKGLTPWVAKNGSALRIKNSGNKQELKRIDRGLCWNGKVREIHSRAGERQPFLAVPVRDHMGRLLGVLRASDKLNHSEFFEEDTIAMLQIARSLANEMERPKATLASLASAIEQNWAEPQLCVDLILRRCGIVAEADAGSIFILEGEVLKSYSFFGDLIIPKEALMQTTKGQGVTAMCARTRCIQVVTDVHAPEWQAIYAPCFKDIRSEVAVPILFLGELSGVINLESKKADHFTQEVQDRVKALAGVAAAYIVHRNMAETNQAFFKQHKLLDAAEVTYKDELFRPLELPPECKIAGHVIHKPCGSAVGGDFYDSIRIDDCTAGFVLIDGKGHGIPGMMHMLPLASAFRTHSRDSRSTEHVLGKILTAAKEMHVMGTAVYFIITKVDGGWRLSGSCAAHPQLIIVPAKGGHKLFPRLELANLGQIGFVDESQMGADRADLFDGDLVIAFSDGIYEGSRLTQRAVELALLGELAPVLSAEPSEIAAAIEQWAIREAGGTLSDDATIIVLRVGRPPK